MLSGVLLALGQAPFNIPWLLFLGAPLIYLVLVGRSYKQAFWLGWFFGLGYFALTLHWIVEPFLVDVATTGWMAPFGLVFMAGGLALFWALPAALFGGFRLTGVSGVLGFAALFTVFELARSTILTGFPWVLLAYSWVDTPIIQGVSFVGSHGLGFLLLALGMVLAVHPLKGALIAGLSLGGAWFAFEARLPNTVSMTDSVVRLIQPNATQRLKWHPDHIATFFDRQLELTASEGNADLTVWPESAVPFVMGSRPDLTALIAEKGGSARVILGATRQEDEEWYNSAVLLGKVGEVRAVYDKHHLTPFGEYLPFRSLFESIGLSGLAQNAGRFSSGSGPKLMNSERVPEFQVLICYEAIFPGEILRGEDRPDWLLQMTNDAWFGDFSGPYQHLALTRVRAVEFGLPVARAANTGVSAMIDPFGRIIGEIELNTHGHLDALLPEPLKETLFSKYGNLPLSGVLLFALGIAWLRRDVIS